MILSRSLTMKRFLFDVDGAMFTDIQHMNVVLLLDLPKAGGLILMWRLLR